MLSWKLVDHASSEGMNFRFQSWRQTTVPHLPLNMSSDDRMHHFFQQEVKNHLVHV